MDGCTVVIEAAGTPDAFGDAQLDRFALELGSSNVTVLSAVDHSRYGVVLLFADVERVGEAFVLGVARFGSAVDFAGLPPLPIVRVELIHWRNDVPSTQATGAAPLASWVASPGSRRVGASERPTVSPSDTVTGLYVNA
jgi:hypothetical protein